MLKTWFENLGGRFKKNSYVSEILSSQDIFCCNNGQIGLKNRTIMRLLYIYFFLNERVSRPRWGYELVFILRGVHHKQNIIYFACDEHLSDKHQFITPTRTAKTISFQSEFNLERQQSLKYCFTFSCGNLIMKVSKNASQSMFKKNQSLNLQYHIGQKF
jgi:hypothetical protein